MGQGGDEELTLREYINMEKRKDYFGSGGSGGGRDGGESDLREMATTDSWSKMIRTL